MFSEIDVTGGVGGLAYLIDQLVKGARQINLFSVRLFRPWRSIASTEGSKPATAALSIDAEQVASAGLRAHGRSSLAQPPIS